MSAHPCGQDQRRPTKSGPSHWSRASRNAIRPAAFQSNHRFHCTKSTPPPRYLPPRDMHAVHVRVSLLTLCSANLPDTPFISAARSHPSRLSAQTYRPSVGASPRHLMFSRKYILINVSGTIFSEVREKTTPYKRNNQHRRKSSEKCAMLHESQFHKKFAEIQALSSPSFVAVFDSDKVKSEHDF